MISTIRKLIKYFYVLAALFLTGCNKLSNDLLFTHRSGNAYRQAYLNKDIVYYGGFERFPPVNDTVAVEVKSFHTFSGVKDYVYEWDNKTYKVPGNGNIIIKFRASEKEIVNKDLKIFVTDNNGARHKFYMRISYDPKIIYEREGRFENSPDAIILHQTNILFSPSNNSFVSFQPSEEERKLVHSEFDKHLNNSMSDFEKAENIALAILNNLAINNCRGIPSDTMEKVNPFIQYKRALSGIDKVQCGNIARIFAYTCIAYNIPVRSVGLGSGYDNIQTPALVHAEGHETNEIFDNKEYKWLLIDLTFNMLSAKYKDELLNARDFYHLLNNEKLAGDIYINEYRESEKALRKIPIIKSTSYQDYLNFYKLNTKFAYPCNGNYIIFN